MVEKKGVNIAYTIRDVGRDYLINRLFKMYNINYAPLIYSIVMMNPVDVAITAIALKIGVNKIVLSLIIAFLL